MQLKSDILQNALYITVDPDTRQVTSCLNSAVHYVPSEAICYMENAAPCYMINIYDEKGKPKYMFEDDQLIELTDNQKFEFDVSFYIDKKIEELRSFTQNYIYNAFSQEKQINSQNDFTYNLSVLSVESGKAKQEIEIAIDMWINGNDLVNLLTNIDTIELTSLYTALQITQSKKYDNYLRTMISSICIYRLIRSVRGWYNIKESDISQVSSYEEYEVISFDDAPVIK